MGVGYFCISIVFFENDNQRMLINVSRLCSLSSLRKVHAIEYET